MYNYLTEKQEIFTEDGQKMFLSIRDRVKKLLKEAGAFRLHEAICRETGSTWTMLACIDRLVELEEIREVTDKDKVLGQYRVFVSK